MDFSEIIKQARKNKKLTQKQLAEQCGISEVSIRKYEAGTRKPKLEQIVKLCDILEIDMSKQIKQPEVATSLIDEMRQNWSTLIDSNPENAKNIVNVLTLIDSIILQVSALSDEHLIESITSLVAILDAYITLSLNQKDTDLKLAKLGNIMHASLKTLVSELPNQTLLEQYTSYLSNAMLKNRNDIKK